jgi:hypothetical protein
MPACLSAARAFELREAALDERPSLGHLAQGCTAGLGVPVRLCRLSMDAALSISCSRPTFAPALGGVADLAPMSGAKVILTLLVLTVLLAGLQAALGSFMHRRRRKAAAVLVGRTCPHCGSVFDSSVTRSARWEDGVFFTRRHVSVTCPRCLTRWMYVDGAFIDTPK